ncbi:MAG: prepilin-type N-terminal cleavage/methylation domain-containing protein [candidate division FCPU426 bacterium]
MQNNKQRGIALIEWIIIVVILLILAIVAYQNPPNKVFKRGPAKQKTAR